MFDSLTRIATALENLLATGQTIVEQQRLIDQRTRELQRTVELSMESFATVTASHQQFTQWMKDHLSHCETWHAKTLAAVVTTGRKQ